MKALRNLYISVCGIVMFNVSIAQSVNNDVFTLLEYNNPGLVVDVSVGLWAWPIPMDYDGDGDMDLVVSCPDKPYNGTYYFENLTGGAAPLFAPAKKITEALKNVQVSFVDDQPRVLIPGYELTNFRNLQNMQMDSLFPPGEILKDFKKAPRFNQWKLVDYDNDHDPDIMIGVDDWSDYGWDNAFNNKGEWVNGPLHGYVYWIENKDGVYINRGRIHAGGKEIDVFGAPSPNFADFDGDGDLDLICGEFLDKFTWFENTGTWDKPVYAEGRFLSNQSGIIKMDLQMIVPAAVDFDKDGHVDLVVGDEDGRVAFIRNTGIVSDKMPVFESPVYFRQQAAYVKFGALVTPVSTDWDDDGDEDIVAGNSAGYIGFIENLGNYNDKPRWAAPVLLQSNGKIIRIQAGKNGSVQGPAEAKWGYTTLSVNDWDGDGLKDIVVNSIWGKVEWFRNTGKKGAPRLEEEQAVTVNWQPGRAPKPAWTWWQPAPAELVTEWRTTPFVIDWNKDGLTDLVMLDHEGYLAWFKRVKDKKGKLLLQPGQRIFYSKPASVFDGNHKVVAETPGMLRLNARENGGSGRRKFTITDWNNDGLPDLVVNSVNASVLLNRGEENGVWHFEDTEILGAQILAGHDTSPTPVNWGEAGLGLLIGAEDGHFYFYKK
ncbi:MAG: VCBS repeat-containing protein [Chitinophagaceae bacterium]|nr:VCBS repeat-containing protein [Chitinophagaceae bacterium]